MLNSGLDFKTLTGNQVVNAFKYIKGLLQASKRNIERINEIVPETDYERMQHFISSSPWDARVVFNKIAIEASELFSSYDKVGLLLDESSHIKKGEESVGVSRQYSGQLGKVENCQIAVYAALSVQPFYTLIDTELYLPQSWIDVPVKCKKAGVPKDRIVHKTKGNLALEIIKRQIALGTRFDWVGGDGFYGNDYQLAKAIDELGKLFVFEVHSDQNVYLQNPVIEIPVRQPGSRGRKPSKLRADAKPTEVRELIYDTEPKKWKSLVIRRGTKGPLRATVLVQKVYVWDHQEEEARERLLIIRKTRTKKGKEEIKYALTNAKEGEFTDLELAKMLSERYFIERAFQDAKQEVGMSEYQVRGWLAWHHHLALVMKSMMFILREKVLFNVEKPLLSANDIRYIMINTYSRKEITEDGINRQIELRHKQRLQDQANNYK